MIWNSRWKELPLFWKRVLQRMFTSENIRLVDLTVKCALNFKHFRKCIKSLTPYLACPAPGTEPFGGLREITLLEICDGRLSQSKLFKHPFYRLATMIDNQHQLKVLRLSGKFQATPQSNAVMTAVASTIEKSNLNKLDIMIRPGSELDIDSISQVLLAFVFSATSHNQSLSITIEDPSITFGRPKNLRETETVKNDCAIVTSRVEGQEKKSLIFNIRDTSVLLQIFSKVTVSEPIILSSIVFYMYQEPAGNSQSILHNIVARTVTLHPKVNQGTMGATAHALILNDVISTCELSLESAYCFYSDVHFSSLGKLIAQHAKQFKTLRSLTIDRKITSRETNMYFLRESYNSTLCEALVLLAEVVPLELRLVNMQNYLKMLCKVWKERNINKKLLSLFIRQSSKIEPDVRSVLDTMADIKTILDC